MRHDLTTIAHWITPGARVLDIGCGTGELLEHLVMSKQVKAHGIELSQPEVSACVKKGLSVVQGNADSDLVHYPDDAFDFVVSAHTLQAMQNPKKVLGEMLRIAKRTIISIPNFGYWYNRFHLGLYGKMPVSSTLSYSWYETPNIHFCTISDFVDLYKALGCHSEQEAYLTKTGGTLPGFAANLFAEDGVFMLHR
jgi:methionine biosynthesis protein MetW